MRVRNVDILEGDLDVIFRNVELPELVHGFASVSIGSWVLRKYISAMTSIVNSLSIDFCSFVFCYFQHGCKRVLRFETEDLVDCKVFENGFSLFNKQSKCHIFVCFVLNFSIEITRSKNVGIWYENILKDLMTDLFECLLLFFISLLRKLSLEEQPDELDVNWLDLFIEGGDFVERNFLIFVHLEPLPSSYGPKDLLFEEVTLHIGSQIEGHHYEKVSEVEYKLLFGLIGFGDKFLNPNSNQTYQSSVILRS